MTDRTATLSDKDREIVAFARRWLEDGRAGYEDRPLNGTLYVSRDAEGWVWQDATGEMSGRLRKGREYVVIRVTPDMEPLTEAELSAALEDDHDGWTPGAERPKVHIVQAPGYPKWT